MAQECKRVGTHSKGHADTSSSGLHDVVSLVGTPCYNTAGS